MTDGMSRLAAALADRYRIERALGAGGMATVYLAEDLKHDRKVAIKVLKPELAAVLGAERFVVEIKTTAALSHPHILPLFDSGTAGGFLFYVMPYIQGETIREKLSRETQFGVEEAVRIAREVADALDYAHRQGVIHRDIKPENILLHDGRPMVMDFGIALAVSAAAGGRMTETGLSLGTPHYMSPEQATADKQITARSDVYSLASVLYEMLTGEPPHTGSSAQAIIMKIVTDIPRPVTELRKSVPAHVAAALAQALEKLPADRFESARAFAEALANPAFRVVGSEAGVTSTPRRGRSVPLPIVGVMATVLVALASWGWTRSAPRMLRDVVRFQTTIPAESSEPLTGPRFALSPDGRTLVYRAADDADQPTAFVRRLDQLESARLTGATAFAVSPDGSAIAFTTAGNELRTMPSAGGSARTITGQVSPNDALEWGEDGYLYHVQDSQAGGVWRVPAEGGTPEQVVARDSIGATAGFSQPREPSVLPGARGLVVTFYRGVVLPSDVAVADLSTREVKYLFKGSHATYLDGFIVFVGENAQLMAVPFDAERLSVTGAPRALGITVANLGESTWAYALSKSGTLVYATQAGGRSLLTWVSREGTGDVVDPELQRSFTGISIDPAGRRLAIAVDQSGQQAIWQYDLRERTMSRVTFDGVEVSRPLWSADGRRIAYLSDRGSDAGLRSIWSSAADGTGEPTLVVASLRHAQEITWSADGRFVAHREGYTDGLTNRDIMVLRAGADTTRRPFLATNADEQNPKLSPDGRWLAYVSDFSGRREVYVQAFPSGSGRWQISSAGGTQPLWRRDGKEIYYLSLDGQFVAVPVLTGTGFAHGAPMALFSTSRFLRDINATTYDITPDGARFLFIQRSDEDDIVVVVNWLDEVKRQFGMSR